MMLAIYNSISIPFEAAFNPDVILAYEIWDNFIDICFGIDIFINFRTTYVNSHTGLEVVGQWKIVKNYIKSGRFFIDLLASIPFEKIYLIFY